MDTTRYIGRDRDNLVQFYKLWTIHHFSKVAEFYSGGRPKLRVTDSVSGRKRWTVRTSFYENGQIERRYCLRNGLFDGPDQSFYPDGQLSESGTWRRAKRLGVWRYYDRTGTQLKQEQR